MNKTILILCLFCFVCKTKAQDKLYQLLADGYKHTIIYEDYKATFFTKKTADKNKFDDSKYYYWYSNNTISATQGGYHGKLLDGNYTAFYLNGNLKEKGLFKSGLKDGLWQSWTSTGALITKMNYKNGLTDGHYTLFEKGTVKETGTYNAGKINGKVYKYISKDSVQIASYNNGELLIPKIKDGSWFKKLLNNAKAAL